MGIIYKRYYDWGSIGEPRYVAYVDNYDLNTIVDIWTPDPKQQKSHYH